MIKNYKQIEDGQWEGRIDSNEDFDSFRWHQWIEPLDLNDDSLETFQGKLGFAFLGFESDLGIQLNKGRAGADIIDVLEVPIDATSAQIGKMAWEQMRQYFDVWTEEFEDENELEHYI